MIMQSIIDYARERGISIPDTFKPTPISDAAPAPKETYPEDTPVLDHTTKVDRILHGTPLEEPPADEPKYKPERTTSENETEAETSESESLESLRYTLADLDLPVPQARSRKAVVKPRVVVKPRPHSRALETF